MGYGKEYDENGQLMFEGEYILIEKNGMEKVKDMNILIYMNRILSLV